MNSIFFKILVLLLLVINTNIYGQVSNATIEQAVKELGGKASSVSVDMKQPQNIVPKYNTDQTGNGDLFGSGEVVPLDNGSAKISNCANSTLDSNLYNRQECESINFVSQNRSKRPNMTVTTNDPIVGTNRATASNPVPILDKYGFNLPKNSDGSIGGIPADACKPTSVVINAQYEERVCSNYKAGERFLCKQNLIANVIPHFNYRCNDVLGRNSTEKCSKILHMDCAFSGAGCVDQIVKDVGSDIPFEFRPNGGDSYLLRVNSGVNAYPSAHINTSGDLYWKKITFRIEDINRIQQFLLSQFTIWDTFLIKINGQIALKSWPVEDRLEYDYSRPWPGGLYNSAWWCIKIGNDKYLRSYTYYGSNPSCGGRRYINDDSDPLIGRNADTRFNPAQFSDMYLFRMPYSANIDVKHLLKTGDNVIDITLRTGSFRGQIDISFIIRGMCLASCTEKWENQCAVLEQRAK